MQLETFTLERNEAIYYIGYNPCFNDPAAGQGQTNRSILGTTLSGGEERVYTGAAVPVGTTDSFDRTLFFAPTGNVIVSVDTSQVANCPNFPNIKIFNTRSPVMILRTYRSVKQPLPGKHFITQSVLEMLQ